MTEPIPVHQSIDLHCHAVIEASAGTGKTYAIQNLVVRILLEKDLQIENILVLTFTEKATAELKFKIRTQIKETLAKKDTKPEDRARLQKALDQFDSAQIFTIHGFCQRVLQQYSFENDESFRLELLTNDDEVYRRLLKEQQRTHWPDCYKDDLLELLTICEFSDDKKFYDTVLKLAKSFEDSVEPKDRIVPEHREVLDLSSLTQAFHASLNRLLSLIGRIDHKDWNDSDLISKYRQLKIHGSTKKSRIAKILIPLSKLLHEHKDRPQNLGKAMDFICMASDVTGFEELGFGLLGADGHAGKIPNLEAIIAELQKLEALKSIRHYLTVASILKLRTDAEKHKKDYGLFGFDDMLRRLEAALDENENSQSALVLKRRLRERYAYALIDESQDTDRVQWRILERIFVEEPSVDSPSRLFLIGDPKQAIYGFRGADVKVYLTAKARLEKDANAQLVRLSENWRSTPPLQEALNALFGAASGDKKDSNPHHWFGNEKSEIKYDYVRPADVSRRKTGLAYDRSGRSPVTVVNLPKDKAIGAVREQFAEFIAREIESLMTGSGGPSIGIKTAPNPARPLKFDDICILVRNKAEARPLEKALDGLGVPHSFYKKQGLYESDEATHLFYLFSAIAYADNAQAFHKALLTHFFRVPVQELSQYTELPPENPIKKLFEQWRRLAERRDWASLFNSIVDDTGFILSYYAQEEGAPNESVDIERRETNYRHILENLEAEARRRHLDFIGILELLGRYRQRSVDFGLDTDIHRIETEKPKVQIMTMHTCKGLEFPIVFLAGGFSAGHKVRYFKFHDAEGRVVYDITCSEGNKSAHKREQDEEDRRLFYVALTRAEFKIYVPRYEPARASDNPLSRFVAPAIANAWNNFDPTVVGIENLGAASNAPEKKSAAPLKKTPDAETFVLKKALAGLDLLAEPDTDSIKLRALTLESYSSLKHEKTAHKRAFGELTAPKGADEIELELASNSIGAVSPITMEISLPRGKETGSFLHDIFQNLDFSRFAQCKDSKGLAQEKAFRDLMIGASRRNQNYAWGSHANTIARLIWNALYTPLNHGDSFNLSQLQCTDRRCEVEFHFPLPRGLELDKDFLQTLGIELHGGAAREGFLIGFIDLVFRRKDADGVERYSIIDWKSDSLESYDAASLQHCMDEAGYTLQYKIYALALARWLAQCGLDFERHFGGIYYLFLRGVNMHPGDPAAGIFQPAGKPDLVKWEKELFGILNQRMQA